MKNKPWEIQSQFKKERKKGKVKKPEKHTGIYCPFFLVAKYLIVNFQMEIIQDVENNF